MLQSDKAIAADAEPDALDLLRFANFDEFFYREQARLPAGANAKAHYLQSGWRDGFEPNSSFEGSFLRPYYEAAGFSEPPALTWLEFSAMGGPAPATRAEAEALADPVRASRLFDAREYSHRLPSGLDPVLHYVVVGERLGWSPSAAFDPLFYLDRYPDVAAAGVSPLWHYETIGRGEGRRPLPAASRLSFPPIAAGELPVILVVSHDASRSGAPVLGWNLVRSLAERYRVVSLLMHGGVLEPDFATVAAAAVGPMTWEEWHPAEARRMAERIVTTYKPLYAIANSVETHLIIPPLVALGVPTVALVHEFAAYTRPLSRMRDAYDWATYTVFPSRIVAESSFRAFPDLKTRSGVRIIAQGRAAPPNRDMATAATAPSSSDPGPDLRSGSAEDPFVILGAGSVEIRKGVDLFISAASIARRLRPNTPFRFIWIGHGYDPTNDTAYSVYLAEQIARSDLNGTLTIQHAVEDLEPYYVRADVFFMCSRLDPQPNVGIEAVSRGIPTVCFEGACGTAEILAADPETRHLVVPHLDAHLAAEEICRLADRRADLAELRAAVTRVGRKAFDMTAYIGCVDAMGRDAVAAMNEGDLETLRTTRAVDPAMLLTPSSEEPGPDELERVAMLRWQLWNNPEGSMAHPQSRRPCAGFHPQRYAQANPEDCVAGRRDPLAHWLRNGRPRGPWSREVFTPTCRAPAPPSGTALRIALHGHFYYPDLAADLARRLALNSAHVDLFLSTDTEAKAAELRNVFRDYPGTVTTRVSPNRGRNIGPLLSGLADEIANGGYDILGHVHSKRSLAVDASMGESWRSFLWGNLIGGEHAMLDVAAAALAANSSLGLMIAEDPHLVGWGANKGLAGQLAARMGLEIPLDDFFDFPLGTMFWARPEALRPLYGLQLSWNDYPDEPLAYDGTILHAIERLLPFVVRHANFEIAGLRAPNTTW